jgi:sugar phosphate permease
MEVDISESGEQGRLTLPFSEHYKRGVLGLLLLAYTFNFIDRTIVNTIGQAIKVDLRLTDTELGLLGGLAFALCYTLLGIPIARLADRSSRVTIIVPGRGRVAADHCARRAGGTP